MTIHVDLVAEVARLRAENEALRASKHKTLSFKVTEKGGLSVYGMGKWPVTLYRGQWERLIEAVPALKASITANADLLSVKE